MKPTAIRKIDAMNPERLSTWFKQKIKMLTTMPNIGDAVKVLQESDFAGPDSGRLRRCMEALNQLHIGREELSRLATVTPNLDAIFQQAIQKAWAEFTRPALEEAEQVQSSVIRQQAQLAALTQELGNAQDQKCELQADIAHWESERERLIRDIRLNSLFGQISRSHLEKFEIISYRVVKASNYSDYTAFVEHFCKTLNLSDVQDRQNAFIAPGQLKSYKAILAPQVEFVLHLAGVTRNAVVILQHAEADWLKFDHFYENGLKTAVDQANANPSSFTFLVIQNFNLSAIECYAAPLLDLLNGVRRKLPGVGQPLPNNLWLFFIPIVQEPETPFGLPLMKHTYRKWGAFARLEGIQVPSVSDGPVLTLEQMTSHSMPVQTNFKEFFNE